MQGGTLTDRCRVGEIRKNTITLEDGRYLILYSFDQADVESCATDAGTSPRLAPDPEPVADEERLV